MNKTGKKLNQKYYGKNVMKTKKKYLEMIDNIANDKGLGYLVHCGCSLSEIKSTHEYRHVIYDFEKKQLNSMFEGEKRKQNHQVHPKYMNEEMKREVASKVFSNGYRVNTPLGREFLDYFVNRMIYLGVSKKGIKNICRAGHHTLSDPRYCRAVQSFDETRFSNAIEDYYFSLLKYVLEQNEN